MHELASKESDVLLTPTETRLLLNAVYTLREIKKGKGRYSHNPLIHCQNTIEDIIKLAEEALSAFESAENVPNGWEGISKKYKYQARDFNGIVWAYENKPEILEDQWFDSLGGEIRIIHRALSEFENWKESLIERS